MMEDNNDNNDVLATNNNKTFSSPATMKKMMMVRKKPMQRSVSDGDATTHTSVRSIYSSSAIFANSCISTDTNSSPSYGSPIQRLTLTRKKEKMAVPPKSPFRQVGQVGNGMFKLITTPIRKVKKAAGMKLYMDGLSYDDDNDSNKNKKNKKIFITKQNNTKIIDNKKKHEMIDIMEKKIDEIDLLILDIEKELYQLYNNKEEMNTCSTGTDSSVVLVDTEIVATISDNNDDVEQQQRHRQRLRTARARARPRPALR